MVACFAPHMLPAFLLLASLALSARFYGWGRCARCLEHRHPKCACPGGSPDEPQVRRPDWKGKR
jgi:hypothetical protein